MPLETNLWGIERQRNSQRSSGFAGWLGGGDGGAQTSFDTAASVSILTHPSSVYNGAALGLISAQVLNVLGVPVSIATTLELSVGSGSTVVSLSGTTVITSSATGLGVFLSAIATSSLSTAAFTLQVRMPNGTPATSGDVSLTTVPSANSFTVIGPQMTGLGLVPILSPFLGDVMVGRGSTNSVGMGGNYSQTRNMEIVSDASSPSGSAMRMNFWGPEDVRCGAAFPPPDFGGQAPCQFNIAAGLGPATSGLTLIRLGLHFWYRFSPNFTVASSLMAADIYDSGWATQASATSTFLLVSGNPAWTPNEYVGSLVRFNQYGAVITSNGTNWVRVDISEAFDSNMFGSGTLSIYSVYPTGVGSSNAGCKGWFWPQNHGRMMGPIAGRGDGAALGSWNAPKDFRGRVPTGDFEGDWWRITGSPPGGIWGGFSKQVQNRWDSPYLEDANDLPIWSGTNFATYPSSATTAMPSYVPGEVVKVQIYIDLGTPGGFDGIWRVWHQGVNTRNETAVKYTELYTSALLCENNGITNRPTIAGLPRDVAYQIMDTYFNNLYWNMTYGGGLGVPSESMYAQLLAFGVSGATV